MTSASFYKKLSILLKLNTLTSQHVTTAQERKNPESKQELKVKPEDFTQDYSKT